MRYSFLLLLFTFVIVSVVSAQDYDYDDYDEDERLIDTIVGFKGVTFRVKRIPKATFDSLSSRYYVEPPTPVKDLKEVEKILGPEFRIVYDVFTYNYNNETTYDYGITEFSRHGKYRLFITESDGFCGYYPKERILTYFGGHSSDQAFNIDTGERAGNPQHTALSHDGRFRLTGLHTGQESIDYNIEFKPLLTGEDEDFIILAPFEKISRQIPYNDMGYSYFIFNTFWANGTLYFYTGMSEFENKRYLAVTPIVE